MCSFLKVAPDITLWYRLNCIYLENKPVKTILFLDDERFPVEENEKANWVIVRTVAQAVRWIKKNGMPDEIFFDNDLQRRLEGKHLAKWLIRVDCEMEGRFIPEDFSFHVHSQNSVNDIREKLNGHLNSRWKYFERPGADAVTTMKPQKRGMR